ncbi:hypothetical protein [Actinophytocola sp.]|uniref:hypothetical protein n=1 Tax=Actinophytocola sp. TaxID=1872138 RepID=UPI003D6C06AF
MRKNRTTGYSPTNSHLRFRRIVTGVAAVVVIGLVAGAFALGRASTGETDTPQAQPVAARMEHGIPVPTRHSVAGAATAAINFQVAGFRVAAGTVDGSAAASTLLASDADEGARQALEAPTADDDQLAETRTTFAPLSTVVVAYGDDRAEIQVWGVAATSSQANPVPGGMATWGRSTITVMWDGRQWRVDTMSYERGPWPVRADERLVDSEGDFGFRFRELTDTGWSYVPEP